MHCTCLIRGSSFGAGGDVASGVRRPIRELVSALTPGESEQGTITGYPHDRLGDALGDMLGIGHGSPHIGGPLGHGAIGCAVNGDAMSVEAGAHRGLQVDGVRSTADSGSLFGSPRARPSS
jgi:hypothetical protein